MTTVDISDIYIFDKTTGGGGIVKEQILLDGGRNMKKLLVTFLSVIMVMVFMPTMAFAANDNVAKIGYK